MTSPPLICVKGSQIGRIEPRSMGHRLPPDWVQITGYATLFLTAVAFAMIVAFQGFD
jgi:hypothetical protein